MKKIKNIVIYGIGGVGGYFGGIMANKIENDNNDDYNVYFISRGNHLKSIQDKGLILNSSVQKGLTCKPAIATDNFSEVPQPDILILSVKSYDLEAVLDTIVSKITENSVVLPLLNGVDIYERIRAKIRKGIVLPSCVYIISQIEKPGIVTQNGAKGHIITGPDPQHKKYYPDNLLTVFNLCNINYRWVDDPYPAIWEKYIFVASYGLVTACFNKSVGEVFNDFELKETTRQIMSEIYNISKCLNIKLDCYIVENSINRARIIPHETKTSFQRDIETKGKQNEGNIFAETIINLAAKTGVETPVTKRIYNQILEKIELKYSLA